MKNQEIPSGEHCYQIEDVKCKRFSMAKTKNCPYYKIALNDKGYCEKLDKEINSWCKECNINE